ncbi:TlpA family protein disulfide reductase [Allokutzneria sp. A3M-2-11 16]|uniref:TlpA family protein disulfide reductase n=1 Tax=Allokutzneria sp. A3M-2-11 16 TaxID=2962043 RepID=UPI0020B809B0|nr:TlpA disulfide reductase family protein [Allokutzneria sp. A3M-2-11 16]MCP3803548.1 TlpA family protein disulfide reductase [Allokutzneria sp. A3M-2-11 16]
MKRAAVALLALVLVACSSEPPRGGKQALPGPVPAGVSYRDATGAAAPKLTLSLVDGTRVSTEDLWRDRPLVLVFFSSWCGQCGQTQAEFTALAEKHRDAVTFLGVAGRDSEADLRRYLDEHRVNYPVARDDEGQSAGRAFALREPPLVALVAKGGALVRGWPGGTNADALSSELSNLVQRR